MSYSDEHLDQLLAASGDRWRASQPELERFSVATLVRQRGQGRSISFPLGAAASLAVVLLATIALLALFAAGPLGSLNRTLAPSFLPASPTESGWPTVLYLENRGGPPFTVRIDGTDIITVACDSAPTLTPGQDNVPQLPWDLTIVRVGDASTLADVHLNQLPRWFVQIGDEPLGISSNPVSGPPGPGCPPASSSAAPISSLLTGTPWPGETPPACPASLIAGRLVEHSQSGIGAATDGEVVPVVWPHGYSAGLADERLALFDATDRVLAYVGDMVTIGGGFQPDGSFNGCGGVTSI